MITVPEAGDSSPRAEFAFFDYRGQVATAADNVFLQIIALHR